MRRKLGINIDGIIRNYLDRFEKVYISTYINNPSIVETEDQKIDDGYGGTREVPVGIKELTKEEEQEKQRNIDFQIREKIKKPIDSNDLLNHFKFEAGKNYLGNEVSERQAMEEFMYDLKAFNIFGQAEPYQGSIDAFHKLQMLGEKENLFDVVLLSTLKGQAITATYFFLSNNGCRCKHLSFLKEDIDKWDHCDAVVDVIPETLQTKPEDCMSIKVETEYNQYDMSDYSFKSLSEAYKDENFIKGLTEFFSNK